MKRIKINRPDIATRSVINPKHQIWGDLTDDAYWDVFVLKYAINLLYEED